MHDMYMIVCMYVGSCLATSFYRQFAGYGKGVGLHNNRPVINGGQLPTNQLHDINWGALYHASRAPQLMSRNYY